LLQNIIDNPVKAFQRIFFTINLQWALSDHDAIASLSGQIFSTTMYIFENFLKMSPLIKGSMGYELHLWQLLIILKN
jgi:hypothetical protein